MYFLLIAIVVGIVIGLFTNYIAIKMLFHPYKVWKIGKWNVPFTPGLIPKRREEIAEQLGNMVENHLFTPEGLKRFIESTDLKNELYKKLLEFIEEYSKRDKKIGDELAKLFGDNWYEKINGYTRVKFEKLLSNEKIRNKTINELLSEDTLDTIHAKIPLITDFTVKEIKRYLLSRDGKQKVKSIIGQLLQSNGGMVGMLTNMLVDTDQIQAKITNYIVQALDQDDTRRTFNKILNNLLVKTTKEPLGNFIDKFDDTIKREADKLLNKGIGYIEDLPMNQVISMLERNNYIEKVYNFLIELLLERMEKIFAAIKIGKVVETEVNKFSIEYLEGLILEVANKELKMITYFGGIIGGLIGVFQGLLYIFLNN